ncbi:SMC-Scp complex subunit ScpB [Actinoplanes xinjiangensis]|uniref:SMC-Scp complex subunit ScpB n=1 Tax=Actinoplanes xinjiangensis TaxID=512350 RepID=UPI00343E98C4
MSSEERPESLAAQAAAWVPPWERRREPDREYQAEAEAAAEHEPAPSPSPSPSPEPVAEAEPDPGPEADPAPVAEAEPESVTETTPESEPVAEAEPEFEPAAEIEAEPEVEPEVTRPESEPVVESEPVAVATVPSQPRRPRNAVPAVAESMSRTAVAVMMDDAELAAALESIMLVVDEPVGELQLAQVLEQPVERIARTLENVSARYTAAGHGIDLRRVAGGWRLYTRPEYAAYVERFVLDGQSVRLTQAALETLAVVAYKQPVTRSRISAIRGVNCDGVMRTLVTRGLIEEVGTEPETGAYLYRTTPLFLEKLGLNSVDQLPPLAPFLPDDVEEVLDASG